MKKKKGHAHINTTPSKIKILVILNRKLNKTLSKSICNANKDTILSILGDYNWKWCIKLDRL